MELINQIACKKPFILIDKVLSISHRKKIVTLKNISNSDIYLWGHFPSYSIYPGMLLLEGLNQTAELLMKNSAYKGWTISKSSSRFIQPVIPGDSIIFTVEIVREDSQTLVFKCIGEKDSQVIIRAKLEYVKGEKYGL